jgi:hypothetical protein
VRDTAEELGLRWSIEVDRANITRAGLGLEVIVLSTLVSSGILDLPTPTRTVSFLLLLV